MISEGRGIDGALIDLIIDKQIEEPTSIYTVKHLFKTKTYLLTRLWLVGALLIASYAHMFQCIEQNEQLFLSNIGVDILFSIKFSFRVDRHEKMLLQECAYKLTPAKIDKRLYSFDYIITVIIEYSFSCLLPPSLLSSSNKRAKLNPSPTDVCNPLQ